MSEFQGKTILVTGGTGSFGRCFATHLRSLNPKEIRVFSRDEKKQWEMVRQFPDLRYIIGDIREYDRLSEALVNVDYVFHAAALKQVPACETYPYEAVKTNVIGSQNLCQAAKARGVRSVVALSTDKAVSPLNAMGISKAMMEKIVCSQNEMNCETIFSCVRYGNVLGTRGSVVELFQDQIAAGLPLTLTVPEMTRFLITLNQSVELVRHALLHSKGGEIWVKKAPACTTLDLAQTMARMQSPQGELHPIAVNGIRPGEKIHETLINQYELRRALEDDVYYTIFPEYALPSSGLNANPSDEEYTSQNTRQLTTFEEISALLEQASQVGLG